MRSGDLDDVAGRQGNRRLRAPPAGDDVIDPERLEHVHQVQHRRPRPLVRGADLDPAFQQHVDRASFISLAKQRPGTREPASARRLEKHVEFPVAENGERGVVFQPTPRFVGFR
ncbi:MAG: hypothetical protein M5U09_20865 [Gammaproteobacteria bacterium]|nr:hypothetical protein [Gammaproteobacteria bacterium]